MSTASFTYTSCRTRFWDWFYSVKSIACCDFQRRKSLLMLGSHHCGNFHRSEFFEATIFIPLMRREHQSYNFQKLSLNFIAQNFLIFIALKYCSDMLVRGIPTMVFDLLLNLQSFVCFLFEKPFFYWKWKWYWSNVVEVGNLIY